LVARRVGDRIDRDDLPPAPAAEFPGDAAALREEIERVRALNRAAPSAEQERTLLHLRNLLAILLLQDGAEDRGHPEPDHDGLPEGPLLEIRHDQLTPGRLRAAILRGGCLLVRGLVPAGQAENLAEEIDRAFSERARYEAGRSFDPRSYVPFEPDPRWGFGLPLRDWIRDGGGVLAVDSPRASFELGEVLRDAGVPELVQTYLGGPALNSGDKTTLRRAEPSVSGAWHQDGKFMGQVRALNLWLSLSHCGRDAPGLDLVPRRLDHHVATMTDEATMLNQVSQAAAERAAGALGILRPIFEPGDALLFDELFLHKTASDRSMRRPRLAVESWFFAPQGFPADYVPLTA
jgi:uncharacterized small protein (DUF1192 family)